MRNVKEASADKNHFANRLATKSVDAILHITLNGPGRHDLILRGQLTNGAGLTVTVTPSSSSSSSTANATVTCELQFHVATHHA